MMMNGFVYIMMALTAMLSVVPFAASFTTAPIRNYHNAVAATTTSNTATTVSLEMGAFDFITNAFANDEKFDDRRARASHILVSTEEECNDIKAKIEGKELSFTKAAETFSKCPSKSKGGSLGEFEPGQMVVEFDDVVFENDPKKASEIGAVVGPVKTQFGYHLIRVDKRFENQQKTDGTGAF
mmetsp:Transcript_45254/g.50736  ORF Transcript_45254/g.50736 Transcript_45254/m.50736 type:complete len:183 (-) Transcript_45254:127-675(-)